MRQHGAKNHTQRSSGLEVRLCKTSHDYERQERAFRADGDAAERWPRDADNYRMGMQVQAFFHNRYENQRWLLNADGTISPKCKRGLVIGSFRRPSADADLGAVFAPARTYQDRGVASENRFFQSQRERAIERAGGVEEARGGGGAAGLDGLEDIASKHAHPRAGHHHGHHQHGHQHQEDLLLNRESGDPTRILRALDIVECSILAALKVGRYIE